LVAPEVIACAVSIEFWIADNNGIDKRLFLSEKSTLKNWSCVVKIDELIDFVSVDRNEL